MSLLLTPEVLRGSYDYLTTTMPFVKWNMPDSDEIKFKVVKTRQHHGRTVYYAGPGKPDYIIEISSSRIGRTLSLMEVMAHEMIHVFQRETGTNKPGSEHSVAFKKLAAEICKHHGFDPKIF